MRFPIGWMVIAAAAALVVVLLVGRTLLQPPRPLLADVGFSAARITPNADGQADIAEFRYSLARNAHISLTLEDATGNIYAFRQDEARIPNEYRVLFSGVVDGFTLPGDAISGEVLQRLLPDGVYTWRLTAVAEGGETAEQSGTLEIADGDLALPELENFTVSAAEFTPNQDGVSDRVQINVILVKDASLLVYLLDEAGNQFFVPERQNDVLSGKAGRHWFDYSAGIDDNADPPPDGMYTVVAEASDPEGQRIRQTTTLTLTNGGKPLAQIVQQPSGADVVFVPRPWDDAYASGETIPMPDEPGDLNQMAVTMPVGDVLVFRLTVENYSRTPIRTTGPEPGTVYTGFDERSPTTGVYESSGAWRVGIQCENSNSSYPWRWSVGTRDTLTPIFDPASENTYYYLLPGERSVVWGAVRMDQLVEVSNPQQCWAGLIHEDVIVASAGVGPREVELVPVQAEAEATAEAGES